MFETASIILNYNSSHDVVKVLKDLLKQDHAGNLVVIVDNNSSSADRERLLSSLSENKDINLLIITSPSNAKEEFERLRPVASLPLVLFYQSDDNRGYSAGNNYGIKIALSFDAKSILVVNPDVEIKDRGYLTALVRDLHEDPSRAISASRIIGLDGRDQNPLKEATFAQEVFWPFFKIVAKLSKARPKSLGGSGNEAFVVDKVIGCCFLVKASFLKSIGLLDESLFLYSEEAVLAAQARRLGMSIYYNPSITAIHAHDYKKDRSRLNKDLNFIDSRLYYVNRYSSYTTLQKKIAAASLGLMKIYFYIKRIVLFVR